MTDMDRLNKTNQFSVINVSKWGWFAVMGITSLFFITLSIWIIVSALDRSHPYQNIRIEVLTPNIPIGGVFRAKISGDRKRTCSLTYIRMVYDFSNTRVAHDMGLRDIPGDIGPDSSLILIQLPNEDSIHTGPALFKQMYQWRCPWNLVHYFFPITTVMEQAGFNIVSKGS